MPFLQFNSPRPALKPFHGDEYVFNEGVGLLTWYMIVDDSIYRVCNPQKWTVLPPEHILEEVRQDDRRRLEAWIAAREKERQEAAARARPVMRVLLSQMFLNPDRMARRYTGDIPSQPPPPKRRPPTDYAWLADKIEYEANYEAEREEHVRYWSKRQTQLLRHKLKALEGRISERWRNYKATDREDTHAFSEFVLARLTDHDYIETMFELYAQQRTRLL